MTKRVKCLLFFMMCFLNQLDAQKDSIKKNAELQEELKRQVEMFNSAMDTDELLKLKYQSITTSQVIGKSKPSVKHVSKPAPAKKKAVIKSKIEDKKLEQGNVRLPGPSQYDSRIELLELKREEPWENMILANANSVGMLVEIEKLSQISKDFYELDVSQDLASRYELCRSEPFATQSVIGTATIFIHTGSTVLTALHVLERPLKHYAIVFGFRVVSKKKNGEKIVFDSDDIYFLRSIVKRDIFLDLVEIRVDRNFNRPALNWENSSSSRKADEVYTLGHPLGLPMKLTMNANILENEDPYYFYTSLDSFQGNSGSPVFSMKTNKVIGILVSGELDFMFNGNCNYSPLCTYPFCKGEKVIRIERFVE